MGRVLASCVAVTSLLLAAFLAQPEIEAAGQEPSACQQQCNWAYGGGGVGAQHCYDEYWGWDAEWYDMCMVENSGLWWECAADCGDCWWEGDPGCNSTSELPESEPDPCGATPH